VSPTSQPLLEKVLVANRGEIAVRVIRACHVLGIPTVAVFSDVDRKGLHVRYADEAVALHGDEPAATYLDQQKIIDAARLTGADAIHPGYGFLAENAAFARRCVEAGLVFIGPSPDVIAAMGDKIRARQRMRDAGVPIVPGREAVTRENLLIAAKEVGYPLMLKASAGGGGKGIRAVHQEGELLSAFDRAQGEAKTAFGDGTVYMERLLVNPHHIEIQILGDTHGNVIHVFERECSVQRRHQKVIEESPSPFMTEELRAAMGEAATTAARAIGYTGAGTVEFLVDANREFYFLEVNTRLQVEHPITEMVTGMDLVGEQLRVAAGLPLSVGQRDLTINGHAFEARICAEDPENGFLPSVGTVDALTLPGGPGVRLDSALYPGLEVSLYYDSLLAKLIVWGQDREQALRRMRQALSEFKVADLKTNIAFLGRVFRSRAFADGVYDTGILEAMKPATPGQTIRDAAAVAAALAAHVEAGRARTRIAHGSAGSLDPW
jgi:acetyl-CoA carboxylase biotin carboxylase subunit